MEEVTMTKAEKNLSPHEYDCALIAAKLRRWETFLRQYELPEWEDLPDFGLYMDQVVALLSRHLDFIPADEGGDKAITVSAVNNYVRLKIMPAPEKKKYNRIHLAYLLMICTLKQSLSIAHVQRMIPMGLTEEEVRARYTAFIHKRRQTSLGFIELVAKAADNILHGESSTADVEDLISAFSAFSGLSRLLTEKLLNLQGKALDETQDV